MKKYIYSLAMLVLGLSSCASWDDPVTEKYGDGPSVAITITETTDSIVVFKVTPAEGTQFYNYITDANDEADAALAVAVRDAARQRLRAAEEGAHALFRRRAGGDAQHDEIRHAASAIDDWLWQCLFGHGQNFPFHLASIFSGELPS